MFEPHGHASEHFQWWELTTTENREHLQPNWDALALDLHAQHELVRLCVTLLEPVRAWWGKPLVITSGFRYAALNAHVGGSKTSQHMKGQAADFWIPDLKLETVFDRLTQSPLVWGQAILEPIGPGARWIHLSLGTKREIIY